jgi:hypothetical protein
MPGGGFSTSKTNMPKCTRVLFQAGVVVIRVLDFSVFRCSVGACPGAHAYSSPGFPHSAYCIHMHRIHTQRWGFPWRHAHLSCSAAGACPGARLMLHNHTCTDCLSLSFPKALQHEAVVRLVVAAPAWQPAPPLWRGGRCYVRLVTDRLPLSAFASVQAICTESGLLALRERRMKVRGL